MNVYSREDRLSIGGVEVEPLCRIVRHVGVVDSQVGDVLLGFFELLLFHGLVAFIRGDLDNTVSLRLTIWLHDGSFVLESLLVVDVVEKSVGGTTLEAIILVLNRRILDFSVGFVAVGLDAEVILVVFLLSQNLALVDCLKRLSVFLKTFFELITFLIFARCWPADADDSPEAKEEEHENWWCVVSHVHWVCVSHCMLNIVTREQDVSLVHNLVDHGVEDLSVSKHPESEWEHHEWDEFGDLKGHQSHLLIEGWWLSVVVADKATFIDEKDAEGKDSAEVEVWHSSSIEEGHANVEQNGGVTIMDQVLWASIDVNIGLNSW